MNAAPAIPWTDQFSMAQPGTDERIFDTIVNAHGAGVVQWLVGAHGEEIARASDGLVDVLRAWAAEPGPSATAWDIAFGRVHLAIKEGRLDDPLDAAVKLGLRIAGCGRSGRWSAPIKPGAVQVGAVLVEGVQHVEVDDDAARIVLRLRDGSQRTLRRAARDDRWACDGGERLESVGRSGTVRLLPRKALPQGGGTGEKFEECRAVAAVGDDAAQSFRDGFAVLELNAPQYAPWVERVVHGIVVCSREEQYRLVSGSWEDVPGFVHMSSPHGGIDIAEVLVHESAHQYFYMLQRVGAVDDASDPTLYWSPPIRKERPLSRILMAYHALANVQLLYEAVRTNEANGLQTIGYVKANEPDLRAAIQALDEPLRDNPALTALGRGLYEPLAERMAALSV